MPSILKKAGSLLADITGVLSQKWWVTISVLVVFPLGFLRRLDSLKYTSILALLAIAYLVGIVVFYALLWPPGMPKGW